MFKGPICYQDFTMKIFAINLHNNKAAMAVLKQKLAMGNADIELIQEPWGQGGQIRGSGGTFVLAAHSIASTFCIFVRNNITALLLLEFCSKDMTTVRTTFQQRRELRKAPDNLGIPSL
jgi:hypothetical protein